MKRLSETYIELGIAFDFPIEIKDAKGNQTYCEESDGYWNKREYDANGNETYYEDSEGYWNKRKYDAKGKVTYCEESDGYWNKREYDDKGNETYYEDSDGYWNKREYDADGSITYYETSWGYKEGTPSSQTEDSQVKSESEYKRLEDTISELKQDKERLDWLLKNCLIKELDFEWVHDSRETIDEAMKGEL